MTMKWRPNDLRVANILRRNFSEKEIDENFRADIDRREFPEIIGFYREVNPLLSMTFVVNSSAFSLCERLPTRCLESLPGDPSSGGR